MHPAAWTSATPPWALSGDHGLGVRDPADSTFTGRSSARRRPASRPACAGSGGPQAAGLLGGAATARAIPGDGDGIGGASAAGGGTGGRPRSCGGPPGDGAAPAGRDRAGMRVRRGRGGHHRHRVGGHGTRGRAGGPPGHNPHGGKMAAMTTRKGPMYCTRVGFAVAGLDTHGQMPSELYKYSQAPIRGMEGNPGRGGREEPDRPPAGTRGPCR